MSAAEKWHFDTVTSPFTHGGSAQQLALELDRPSEEAIARIVGAQAQFISSIDALRQSHVELVPQISSYRLAFGGPLEYQAKFRSVFNRLFIGLKVRPELHADLDKAWTVYNHLAAIGFELHHNATEHADLPGGSPTRIMALSYDPVSNTVKLEVSDVGPGIVEHYAASMLGGFKSRGCSSSDTLLNLLLTHESSIPSRSLGGGLPKVLALSDAIQAKWRLTTNSLLAEADKEAIKVVPVDSVRGTHWEVEVSCR